MLQIEKATWNDILSIFLILHNGLEFVKDKTQNLSVTVFSMRSLGGAFSSREIGSWSLGQWVAVLNFNKTGERNSVSDA